MEITPFHKLISEAWTSSRTKKFPWVFGVLIAGAGLIGSHMVAGLFAASSFSEFASLVREKSPEETVFLVLTFLALFASGVYGKGNLIVSLSFIVNKSKLPNHPHTLRAQVQNFARTFIIECLAVLILLVIGGILCLPFVIATEKNPAVVTMLQGFGLLTFLPLAIIVFLIKQYTLFYSLLPLLSLRRSIETSIALFLRFVSSSFIFTILTFLLALLFTFLVNLVILEITALGISSIIIFVSFIFYAWYAVFEQALWLCYFKSIARPKDTSTGTKEEVTVLERSVLPETPPTQ